MLDSPRRYVPLAPLLVLLVLLFGAPSPVGAADSARPHLDAVAAWVAEYRGTDIPERLPLIVYLPHDRLVAAFDAARQSAGSQASTDLLAFYNSRTETIYLSSDWTGDSPAELSILVHEMVHHFQQVEAERFACGAAREKDAYAAQEAWLQERGLTLESALGTNPLFVLLVSNCMF
jgi:hypothetical protein